MSEERTVEQLVQAMQAVQRLIDLHGGSGLVIGGVAVSLVARPRFTRDVDQVGLEGPQRRPARGCRPSRA